MDDGPLDQIRQDTVSLRCGDGVLWDRIRQALRLHDVDPGGAVVAFLSLESETLAEGADSESWWAVVVSRERRAFCFRLEHSELASSVSRWEEIPTSRSGLPSVREALDQFRADRDRDNLVRVIYLDDVLRGLLILDEVDTT